MSSTTQAPPLLVSVEETAHLLSMSRSTIYNLVNSGQLPLVRLGKSARVPRAAVEALVAELIAEAHTSESPAVSRAGLSCKSGGQAGNAQQL
jgi:excisionase family DNA binding protein